MARPIVILHGWSDHASSFNKLAHWLQTSLNRPVSAVHLADYITMDDTIGMADLAVAMMHAWQKANLPIQPKRVDVIVHSTGGLVIRDWLTRFFQPETAPIKHLVMLAPANFGSPLAHKGRAFLGRLVKGMRSQRLFQTGTQVLKALELASPYSWQLAERDRFGSQNFYGPGKILTTVLIGDSGYHGIAAAANEVGSDGTVRLSTANLNCARVEVDFMTDPLNPRYQVRKSQGQTAFAVVSGENHSTIAAKQGGPNNPQTLALIKQALTVSDRKFPDWCMQLTKQNQSLASQADTLAFQNTVVHLSDQFDNHIDDYFIEFSNQERNPSRFEEYFHQTILNTTHCYGDDRSFRSLYVNCHLLQQQGLQADAALAISLVALPEFKQNKTVGYRTFNRDDIGAIHLNAAQVKKVFQANRTVLVKMLLRREQSDAVFKIT